MGVLFAMIILGGLLYVHVLRGEFISDDYILIVENSAIRNPERVADIWHSFNTRFLVGLSFALNYSWGKLDVFGYHLVNIILHIANAFLVYKFIGLIFATPLLKKKNSFDDSLSIAFFSALIFLCHPIQTQGVSFVTQRAVEMGALFYLLTIVAYLRWRISQKRFYYSAAMISLFLGIFSKEMIFTVPLVMVLCEIFFFDSQEKSLRVRLKMLVPFFLLDCLLPIALWLDQPGSNWELKHQMVQRGWNWWYFLTEINVLRTYLRLLFFPIMQAHEYPYELVRSLWEVRTLFSIAVLGAVFAFACRQFAKNRLLSFAIFWFFITTSIEVAVVSIVNRSLIYEHWLYLPMVGFALFVTVMLTRIFKDPTAFRRIITGILIVLSGMTYQRNFVWQNEIAFWEDGKAKAPLLPNVYLGAGNAYQRKGMYREAYSNYHQALQFYDHNDEEIRKLTQLGREFYARIYSNLGVVCYLLWKDDEVMGHFQKAIELDPTNGRVFNNQGLVYFYLGKYRETIEALQKSIALQGDYAEGNHYLGLAYQALGQTEVARGYFQKALDLFRYYGDDYRVKDMQAKIAVPPHIAPPVSAGECLK